MPVPLNSYNTLKFDPSVCPPWYASYPGYFISGRVDQTGWRWAPGDDKQQVLTYSGRKARGKNISVASTPAPAWYYEVKPFDSYHSYSGNDWLLSVPPAYGVVANNRAYEKFKDVALGENASWGTTVAEGREALTLIGDRAIKLRKSYKHLRRGEFKKFLRELSVDPKRKHRSVVRTSAKEASGLWLEYWFGWSPLVGEIYQSTIALTVQQRGAPHFATAFQGLPERDTSFYHPGGIYKIVSEGGGFYVKTGATVRYDNYNVALAQQMGLVNPLSVAWELVPFSFVVDWFSNVGQMLDAHTDFYGVTLLNAYRSYYLRTRSVARTGVTWANKPGTLSSEYRYQYQNRLQNRRLGLISPVLTYPKVANFGNSKTRAATAVSLLVQIFLDN